MKLRMMRSDGLTSGADLGEVNQCVHLYLEYLVTAHC